MRVCFLIAATAACCAMHRGGALPAAELRYAAQFMNGQRRQGQEIHDWQDTKARPRLDDKALFDAGDPVRWIHDTTLPLADPPEAYVEFHNGDRLPGQVATYLAGTESHYRRWPPHLLVAADVPLDWPDIARPRGLPVLTRFVRKVVWQRRQDERFQPGTVFFRDGRQVEFRSLRWLSSGVRLLLDQGARDVPFDDMAEVHLPRTSPWEAYFDQLATAACDGGGTLMQLETTDGLRVTAPSDRFQAFSRGGGDRNQWFHMLQPAWSAEPLWLRYRSIAQRRYFRPDEVPLTAIAPDQVVQRSSLDAGWTYRVDRNVKGGPLRSGGQLFGWGFGAQADNELEFLLPACARGLRTQLGLDHMAGSGGCVRAFVFAGPKSGTPLFASKHLIGSTEVLDVGVLPLPAASNATPRLTLVVDAARDDRPPGTDPLEVRDTFDWLQPMVELDPAAMKLEIERRQDRQVYAWQDWVVGRIEPAASRAISLFDTTNARAPEYRLNVAPVQGFLSLTRKMTILPQHTWLALAVSRFHENTTPACIRVAFNGQAVGAFEVPVRQPGNEPDPLLVPVERFRGHTVHVELAQMGDGLKPYIDWRGATLAEHAPTRIRLFDDDPAFISELTAGDAIVRYDETAKYFGTGCLKMTPGESGQSRLPGWNYAIRENPGVGEFRFLRFAWKKVGGKQIGLNLAHDGVMGQRETGDPRTGFAYEAGQPQRNVLATMSVHPRAPTEWQVVTRDLYADFGPFQLTGMGFVCPDGEAALFDQILLVRRFEDFDRLPGPGREKIADPSVAVIQENIEQGMRFANTPAGIAALVGEFHRELCLPGPVQGVWLWKKFQGRDHVLATHPADQQHACILRWPVSLPPSKPAQLRLSVSHAPQGDWQLIVKANAETLHDTVISASTVKEGWADLTIDLARFAGRNVALELHNHPNNWSNEAAFWSRVEIAFP